MPARRRLLASLASLATLATMTAVVTTVAGASPAARAEDPAGVLGLATSGAEAWLITTASTVHRHLTLPGVPRQVTQPVAGQVAFLGDGWVMILTVADGTEVTHRLEAGRLSGVADGQRLALLVTEQAAVEDAGVVPPPVHPAAFVDLLTGTTTTFDQLGLARFEVGRRLPAAVVLRGADRTVVVRLDAATPNPVDVPGSVEDLVADEDGTRWAVMHGGSVQTTDGTAPFAERTTTADVGDLLGWLGDRLVVRTEAGIALVDDLGRLRAVDVPGPIERYEGRGVLRLAGDAPRWGMVDRTGRYRPLPVLDGMSPIQRAGATWWFADLERAVPTTSPGPVAVLDLVTAQATPVRGTLRQLAALTDDDAGSSADGRLRWATVRQPTGHPGVVLGRSDGEASDLSVLALPIVASPDDRHLLSVTVQGVTVTTLGPSTVVTPVVELGRDVAPERLRWVTG